MNFTVIASFSVKKENIESFEMALKDLTTATRQEQGCTQYDVHTSSDTEGSYFIIEEYLSLENYLSHRESQHVQNFRQIAAPLFKKPPVVLRGTKTS